MHTDTLLRGDPHDLITVPKTRIHGVREDGSPKGTGYFGPLALVDEEDCYTAELPFNIGTGWLVPLVVPTLTRAELTHLVGGGRPTREILHKAMMHAQHRYTLKQPAFAAVTEPPLPLPD
jgi:hypothetical protein